MGIFSSKYKTYVGSFSSRMIEDNLVPNSIITGTAKAILRDGDIAMNVITDLSKGLGTKARSMFNFGKNSYIFGTPDAKIHTSTVGSAEVLAVLASLYPGQDVDLLYSHLGAPNILHIGWLKLMRDHGYNPVTNKLGALSTSIGRDVFLHDLVVVLPTARASLYYAPAIEQWGTAAKAGACPTRPGMAVSADLARLVQPTPVEVSATATEDHARVEYAWLDAAGAVQRGSFTMGNSEFDELADFFHAGFTLDGVQQFWIYEAGEGTHPSLDALGDTSGLGETVGNFFPILHFRNNKQSLAANTESVEFKDSKKMARKLGIDYMQVHDAIHENPDIADIAQAYLTMLVPAVSTDPLDRRYLFEFFAGLHSSSLVIPPPTMNIGSILGSVMVPRAAILIQDKKVKHTLSTTGIRRRLVAGSLGEGVEYSSGFVATPAAQEHHYYRRQISPAVYDEILVYGLEMRYWVQGNYSAVGDEEDAQLLIPLDYSITRQYPLQLQERLYARSMHLICNSAQTIKIKWYQRGAFATFLKIVGVVLILVDGGFTASLTAAIAAGVGALIQFVVLTLLVQQAVSLAFQLFVKIVGADFALLLAFVAAIYGGYKLFKEGIKAAGAAVQTLLQISTGLVQGAAKVVVDDLLELGKEFEVFNKESEEKMDLLEQTKALLESSTRMSPLVIFGETPTNYFNRTVHSGNVGTIGYTAIESYVDMALTLPKLSDTVGSDEYAF